MTRIRSRYELLFNMICACLVLLMAACGGGGGLLADGGIGGSGVVSAGSVSSLGSIVVNGVHYRVTDANYTREDESSVVLGSESQTEIRVGMVVEVDGELDMDDINGQALTIRYEDVLEGPNDTSSLVSLDGTVKILSILNQQVIVEDGFTELNGVTYAGLDSFSGILEVSGFRHSDGRIQATYLENRTVPRLEIKGVVTLVNSATSFDIGSLSVLHDGTVPVTPQTLVEVKGSAYAASTLTATTVRIESEGFSVANKDAAEIEGFVSDLSGSQFKVNGQNVTISATTLFDGGAVTDLVNGSKVEAEGVLSGSVLAARKISFKEGVRLESNIASIVAGNGTLTLEGLTNVIVVVDAATTEFNGTSGLTALNIGDHVKVRGQVTSTAGTVLATRLDLVSPSSDVELRGPVEDDPIVPGQITILNISVDTTPISIFSIEEDDGITVTQTTSSDFFNRLVPNEIVKLIGTLAGSVNWNQAEKQNEL